MSDTIFLLNFRRGTLEQIPESTPPQVFEASSLEAPEPVEHPPGFVLAALGTPPRYDEE